ncbi:hypothetical protein NO357_05840 [Marimonas arenosa]|uniref:Uncharacterized protein n=1 Tax=Marimonas arenosa TaxID=1795305 RepID=A0AAE4B4I9_9RHOB|nr:hypothetical protein [Marimonas arenosa]
MVQEAHEPDQGGTEGVGALRVGAGVVAVHLGGGGRFQHGRPLLFSFSYALNLVFLYLSYKREFLEL